MRNPSISLLLISFLFAACSSGTSGGNGGSDALTIDAADQSGSDAAPDGDASAGQDALSNADASSQFDASPGQDAGARNDAGARADAGTRIDAGAQGIDAGAQGIDAGAQGIDAGAQGIDAGQNDAGSSGNIQTVFLILMENHNWSDILGNTTEAPYINNMLLPMSSYTTAYFDNPSMVHPSEPNYIWLEAGDNLNISNDSTPGTNHQSTTQHLVTLLANAGVTWKAYQEDIDGTICPIHNSGLYAPKHCGMLFFDDIVGNPPSTTSAPCISHVRPANGPNDEFHPDLMNNRVAQYNFITPNLCNDMHNATGCPNSAITNGDMWLQNNIPLIMASQAYQNNGAIFVTWDESEGGEHPIGMIVISPKAKGNGYNNAIMYYHSSMLRTVQEIFNVTPLLRDAANRPSLSDLFTSFP